MTRPTAAASTLAALAALAAAPASAHAQAQAAPPSLALTIDGDTADWVDTRVAAADEHFIYARFSYGLDDRGGPTFGPPQAAPETTRVVFDLDDDPATGVPLRAQDDGPADFRPMGVDLEILFSPRAADTPRGPREGASQDAITGGAAVVRYDRRGRRDVLAHQDVDLLCAPTVRAPWYELRLARLAPGLRGSPAGAGGPARVIVLLTDADNRIIGWGDDHAFDKPAVVSTPPLADADPPPKPAGALRVVSHNVLRASPEDRPDPFARLYRALRPDAVLIQEWDRTNDQRLARWFDRRVGADSGGRWHATAVGSTGVAIASPHPITASARMTEADIPAAQRAALRRVPRAVAAAIDTPAGPLAVLSTHLKCCGSADSPEEATRRAEAAAIAAWFDAWVGANAPGAAVVLGGDVNLVGTRAPLELLAAGGLAPVEAPLLGDAANYTWRGDRSAFAPGRLDWLLYDPAAAGLAGAFALDTRRLAATALERAGLRRNDTAASDHLPLVADLVPAR